MGKTKKKQRKKKQVQKRRFSSSPAASRAQGHGRPASYVGTPAHSFGPRELLRLYMAGKHDELSQVFLSVTKNFSDEMLVELDPASQATLDMFVECLLYVLTKPDYVIPRRFRDKFVLLMPAFTNLVAISTFRTSDPQLEMLRGQPDALPKILALYSARNRVRIDYDWLFDQDPGLASLWYASYFHATTSSRTQTVYENLRHHLGCMDNRLKLDHYIATNSMFYCTYIAPNMERAVKETMNAAIGQKLTDVTIRNEPNPRSIAILTDRWIPTSSVYRGLKPFIEALGNRYDLTLVNLDKDTKGLDPQLFSDVRSAWIDKSDCRLRLDSLKDNNFQLAFYTDVGMSVESRYLSNLRIAPIQVTSYGHPISTRGSQIDYFVGGTELEVIADAQKNYSERLVLIPGGAVFPTIPSYQPTRPPRPTSQIVINCVWSSGKCNWPMMMILKKILKQTKRKVLFQFLPYPHSLRMNGFIPYKNDIVSEMGAEYVRVLTTTFDEYMQALETAHFSIDSYPFGSFTGVVDALHVGIPMVTWEGERAYNRSASRLNRKAGLEELIAHSEDEYVEKICRLIEDDEYRNGLYARIGALDLKEALFDPKEVDYFVKAIDCLIENHEALQRDTSREPIMIPT